MDKTTLENKIILGSFGKCRQNSNILSHHCLNDNFHYEREDEAYPNELRNITDFKFFINR